MPIATQTIACPPYYSLHETCHAHGWKHLAPFGWIEKKRTLTFAVEDGNCAVDVRVRQVGARLTVTFDSEKKLIAQQRRRLLVQVRRALDVDREISGLLNVASAAGAEYEKMIKGGAGRLLRAPTLWEDAAKTLFTTNCSWSLTVKMAQSACSETFALRAPSGAFAFPSPGRIVKKGGAGKLRNLMPIGYRAGYLHALAAEFHADPALGIPASAVRDAAFERISRLLGFGPYATNHVLLMAGFFDEVPVDTVVSAFVADAYNARNAHSFVRRTYRKWGRYAWWGLKLDQMRRQRNWIGD